MIAYSNTILARERLRLHGIPRWGKGCIRGEYPGYLFRQLRIGAVLVHSRIAILAQKDNVGNGGDDSQEGDAAEHKQQQVDPAAFANVVVSADDDSQTWNKRGKHVEHKWK